MGFTKFEKSALVKLFRPDHETQVELRISQIF